MVLIAHAQASERAATGLPLSTRAGCTGGAVEAKVTFCEIKGFTEQKLTFASAVTPAQ
ncbi:hypothetical protein [Arenimonas sp. MALMAid1274]|uniref:hypothetical protein n=1 Tax=Arenimonas sp. MALMAid1274 TaxID=3411630 RepID=UPI003BA156D0